MIHKLHKIESPMNGLMAVLRERTAEDSEDSAISSDSELHFVSASVTQNRLSEMMLLMLLLQQAVSQHDSHMAKMLRCVETPNPSPTSSTFASSLRDSP